MTTYTKPTLTKKASIELTRQERQLIARLRQLRNAGKEEAHVILGKEDGPRVREQAGLTPGRVGVKLRV